MFETWDNDAIDLALEQVGHRAARQGILHKLESSWGVVVVALVLVVGTVFTFFKWGLPFTAERIAHSMPVQTHELVAAGTMKLLDKVLMEPSKLANSEQDEITQRFQAYLSAIDTEEFNLRLYFRDMKGIPNALALPSGEIIVTDGLVKLAGSNDELDAVIMHEIGHVLHRHGMQHVIEASAITLIASLALGDVSGVGELAVGVPTFLLQSSYARESELEADNFAFEMLADFSIDPAVFSDIILKLGEETIETDTSEAIKKNQDFSDYLSTHPGIQERAANARAYSDAHFRGP